MAEETASAKGNDAILIEAQKRFKIALDAEGDSRELALDDLRFANGDQWPGAIRAQRSMDGRPCLTINKIKPSINQVKNDQRQNRPSIQVNPVDDKADIDTAEVIQGLIRHVEYDSGADEAYDTAFESAVTGGIGYFRITTEYEDQMSFEQVVKIRKVENPFSVYYDPGGSEADYSDRNWCFVALTMTKEQYQDRFPESEWSGNSIPWTAVGDGWLGRDSIRVAEYYYREMKEKTIILWSDGQVFTKENAPTRPPDVLQVGERKTYLPFVKWKLINYTEVLDEKEWVGQWIPVVPVMGDVTNIDGERSYKGMVRDARDAQMQYNFMETAATEAIALAPKAPWVATAGMIADYKSMWASSNTANHAALLYKPDPLVPGGRPTRESVEPPIQAMMLAVRQAADDLKSTLQINDASLGNNGNETSGKAILARQSQSQMGNFHYIDNLSRALKHAGRILLDLIPKVYSTERVLRIIGEDGNQKTVTVNADAQQLPPGVSNVYDLTVGKYDVTISVGPSYQTKRQEAVNSMLELVKAFPQLMQVAGDLLVSAMDWPGANKIAERLKMLLPPQVSSADDESVKGALQGLPDEVKQKFMAMMMQLQQLQQQNQQLQQEQQMQLAPKQAQIASDERIAMAKIEVDKMKIAADLAKTEATINVDAAQASIDREQAMLEGAKDRAHDFAMSHVQHAQAQDLQATAQENAPQPVQ